MAWIMVHRKGTGGGFKVTVIINVTMMIMITMMIMTMVEKMIKACVLKATCGCLRTLRVTSERAEITNYPVRYVGHLRWNMLNC